MRAMLASSVLPWLTPALYTHLPPGRQRTIDQAVDLIELRRAELMGQQVLAALVPILGKISPAK